MKARFFALVAACAASVFVPADAEACGGCYHRESETETTVVTGHRMVLSVSPVQTVLWDQIQYDGNPSDFAWVLPVKPGARIELATDAWFETLDAATAAQVVGPRLDCPGAPGASNGGCGASEDAMAGMGGEAVPAAGGVTVLHDGTVGPYETVTLSTETPGALNDWLTDHGYAVDADVQPIVDAYDKEGFDFIALRLQPGAGVRAMKPVRVVSPGASPVLPLRMVAAGTGAHVAITLFVISEGRWSTKNFPNGTVPVDRLEWDHLTEASNYAILRDQALTAGDGKTWLTTFAKKGPLLSAVGNPTSFGNVQYTTSEGPVETIAGAYFSQARSNGETGSPCASEFATFADSGSVVVDPCPAADPDGTCGTVEPDEIDARQLACGAADDLGVALTGLHPRDVWLTRLESNLPRAALATDLELEPATAQSSVENWLEPATAVHEQEVCRGAGDRVAVVPTLGGSGKANPRLPFAAIVTGLCALLAATRRSRRHALATAGS